LHDLLPRLGQAVALFRIQRRLAVTHAGDGLAVVRRQGQAALGEKPLVHRVPDVHAVKQGAVQIEDGGAHGERGAHGRLSFLPRSTKSSISGTRASQKSQLWRPGHSWYSYWKGS